MWLVDSLATPALCSWRAQRASTQVVFGQGSKNHSFRNPEKSQWHLKQHGNHGNSFLAKIFRLGFFAFLRLQQVAQLMLWELFGLNPWHGLKQTGPTPGRAAKRNGVLHWVTNKIATKREDGTKPDGHPCEKWDDSCIKKMTKRSEHLIFCIFLLMYPPILENNEVVPCHFACSRKEHSSFQTSSAVVVRRPKQRWWPAILLRDLCHLISTFQCCLVEQFWRFYPSLCKSQGSLLPAMPFRQIDQVWWIFRVQNFDNFCPNSSLIDPQIFAMDVWYPSFPFDHALKNWSAIYLKKNHDWYLSILWHGNGKLQSPIGKSATYTRSAAQGGGGSFKDRKL